MKNSIYFVLLIMMSFTLMSSGCSTDDDGNQNNPNPDIAQIESTVNSGTWRITSYIDSNQDQTSDFNGYNFTFESNGTLTAQNDTTTMSGTWSITESNSSDDDDDDDIDFNIFFPVPDTNNFEDLNDDWDIVSYTTTTLSLIDISGGNGGTDTLIFEKN